MAGLSINMPPVVKGGWGHCCYHEAVLCDCGWNPNCPRCGGDGGAFLGAPHLVLRFWGGRPGYGAVSVYDVDDSLFEEAKKEGWRFCEIATCGRGDDPIPYSREELDKIRDMVARLAAKAGLNFKGVSRKVFDSLR